MLQKFSSSILYIFLVFLSLFLFPIFSYASTITSVSDGSWDDINTWDTQTIPTENDEVEIKENTTVEFGCAKIIKSKILNKGNIVISCTDFSQAPFFENDITNFGNITGVFSLKAYLYNSGKVNDVLYWYNNPQTNLAKIKNSDFIKGVVLKENLSVDEESDLNFDINGNSKELKIFSGITINHQVTDINIVSDQEQDIFLKHSSNLNGNENIILNIAEDNLTLSGEQKNFNKIIIGNGLNFRFNAKVISADLENNGVINSVLWLKGDLINNGSIKGTLSLYKNPRKIENILINNGQIEQEIKIAEPNIVFSENTRLNDLRLKGNCGSNHWCQIRLPVEESFNSLEYLIL